jgi:hypothetical protein
MASDDSREENVYMAKLAEQAERYDEVRSGPDIVSSARPLAPGAASRLESAAHSRQGRKGGGRKSPEAGGMRRAARVPGRASAHGRMSVPACLRRACFARSAFVAREGRRPRSGYSAGRCAGTGAGASGGHASGPPWPPRGLEAGPAASEGFRRVV